MGHRIKLAQAPVAGNISGTVTYTVTVTSGETLTIAGTGAVEPGATAVGVVIDAGGRAINHGNIIGGGGAGYDSNYNGLNNAAIGVAMNGGTLVNAGNITGGNGANGGYNRNGGGGADGVDIGGGMLKNSGSIFGGSGGNGGGMYGYGSFAGNGVDMSGGVLQNTGTIEGGAGGGGYRGGEGGYGVILRGGTLINAGVISGGSGPLEGGGGCGVLVVGGTLVNAGTISGNYGTAVQIGGAATLVIDPGAVFGGQVAAFNTDDVLDLAAGAHTGTLSGLGSDFRSEFTGFTTIEVDKGANWVLSGPNTTSSGSTLDVVGVLTVDAGAGQNDVFGGVVKDGGRLIAGSGTLTLDGAVAGSGTLSASGGATLVLGGGGSFAGALTGPGTIDIAADFSLSQGASLSAAKVILQASLALGAGTGLNNDAGHKFSLDAASGTTLTLTGAAGDGFANSGSLVADGAGTADFSVGLANAGQVVVTAGTLAFLATVTNTGTIDAAGGVVAVAGAVGGTGQLDIGKTGTLWLHAGAAAGQSVDFCLGRGYWS